jgi:hypothetical protein
VGSKSDNGGEWPSDGGSPDDLPDLPEEWGVIVIPDDLAELADEVAAVRAELRLTRPGTRWQRFTARPAVRRLHRIALAGVHTPVLIISIAVLVTVASLFASAWPGPNKAPATQHSTSTTDESSGVLPALDLIGPDGAKVALRAQRPAVILLTDSCDCAPLIAETIIAVRPEIAVIIVTSAAPPSAGATAPTGASPQAQDKTVLALRDPQGLLRASLGLADPHDGTATALLVNSSGEIVRTLTRTHTVDELKPDLARL